MLMECIDFIEYFCHVRPNIRLKIRPFMLEYPHLIEQEWKASV